MSFLPEAFSVCPCFFPVRPSILQLSPLAVSPEHTANTSPKSSSPRCEFAYEAGDITIVVPQSSACVNGSPGARDSGSGKPAGSLGTHLGPLARTLPLSASLQNLGPRTSADPSRGMGAGRRWSFDKPGEEEKAAIAAALEKSGPMVGDNEGDVAEAALPEHATASAAEADGKKPRKNFFSHGRSDSGKGWSQSKDEQDDKHKGHFGAKDSHNKLR